MNKPFQRKGATSNTQVGRDFEAVAQAFFERKGLPLQRNIKIDIGINGKKAHAFDLGNPTERVLVECKSHTWTEGTNVPSAKMTAWNQAMYFFYATLSTYRKIFFVLRDFSEKREETLADYYIRTYTHLIPADVEIWEYNEDTGKAEKK
jgi:hypothetical protein